MGAKSTYGGKDGGILLCRRPLYGSVGLEERIMPLEDYVKQCVCGEPFIFGIPEGTVGDFVTRRGFELVSDLSGPELDRRYLADASGNVLGQVHAYASVATCRIA